MEKHVCTLEQAKELKKLGIEQCSFFTYGVNDYDSTVVSLNQHPDSRDEKYSAFTVSELGLMLPPGAWSCIVLNKGKWCCFVAGSLSLEYLLDTEAEARAEKLIQLLKAGVIKVTEVNERLGAVVA